MCFVHSKVTLKIGVALEQLCESGAEANRDLWKQTPGFFFLYEQIFRFVSLEMFCAFYNLSALGSQTGRNFAGCFVFCFLFFVFAGGAALQRLHAAVI